MSKTYIRDVLVKIGADASQLDAVMKKSLDTIHGFSIAAAAAIGTATGAMIAFTAAAAKNGIEIQKLAKLSRASTDEFQRWSAASKTVGIEQDKLADIMKDVNDKVGDFLVTGAGPMKDFFDLVGPKIGVTADQFRKLSGPQALQLYVSSLEKAGVNQQQMTFFLEAIASDSALLAPLLANNGQLLGQLGDQAQRLGVILDEDTIAALQRSQASFTQIGQTVSGFGNKLVAEVAPALEAFSAALAESLGSDTVQQSVDRLAGAFGNLLEKLSSPEAINAFVAAFDGFVRLADAGVSALIFLTDNVELATAAFSALAVAVWAAGGPISAVIGLAAAAAAGIAVLAGKLGDAEDSGYDAEKAQKEVNQALADFATSAGPAARSEAQKIIQKHLEQARAALSAAQAELKLQEALGWDPQAGGIHAVAGVGPEDGLGIDVNRERVQGLESDVRSLLESLKDLDNLPVGPTTLPAPQSLYGDDDGGGSPGIPDDDEGSKGSDGGGAEKTNPWLTKLETLRDQIATEKELIQNWYDEGREILRNAREQGLIDQAEFDQRSLELNEKYHKGMNAIDSFAAKQRRDAWSGALGDLSSLMSTNSKKLFQIGKAAALAQATIDGWSAATSAWDKGMKIGGPPVASAFTAMSLARTGAMIASIASQDFNGSSASGGGGGGAGSGSAAAAPPAPLQVQMLGISPDSIISGADLGTLLNRLNDEAGDRGYNLLTRG